MPPHIFLKLNFLGVFSINKIQRKELRELLNECTIIEMNDKIKELCISLKQKYKVKIPDAIIAASSIVYGLPLITSDADFKIIKELSLIFIEK